MEYVFAYRGFDIYGKPSTGTYQAFIDQVLKFECGYLDDIFDAIDSYRR